MIHRPFFEASSVGFRVFTFVFLLLFGLVAGIVVGSAINMLFFGTISNITSHLQAARIMQLSTQLGLFVFPPLLYALLFSSRPFVMLGYSQNISIKIWIPALLLMLVSLPMIHQLATWNTQLRMPEFLAGLEKWMQEKEAAAERLTTLFLEVKTIKGLLLNLLMIALIPAIGEELVFRSVFQPLFIRLFRNIHIGIIFGALVFSAMHFQFYGLLPRFILGIFLGYLFYWSGSIWVPIGMHLLNNGLAVVAFFMHYNQYTDVPMDEFGAAGSIWVLISAIFTAMLFYLAFRWRSVAKVE